MKFEDLKEQIFIEFGFLDLTVQEIISLRGDIGNNEPNIREKAAASTFLAQFYNGIENILKRICRFQSIQLPKGEYWHIQLFDRYCSPSFQSLPVLFDDYLKAEFAPLRRFRHIVHHGYSFQIEWKQLKLGMENIEHLFEKFKSNVLNYLEKIKE